MRWLFIVHILLLFMLAACKKEQKQTKIPCLPASLGPEVLAFYPFSSGSINDFSGNGHHLLNTSSKPAMDRTGANNCAFSFDQSSGDQFLSLSSTSFLNNLSQFSISLWYCPTDTLANKFNEILVSRGEVASCPDRRGQWSLGLFDCHRAVFAAKNSVWDRWDSVCSAEVIKRTGKWHYAVATYDVDKEDMKIYRNGVLQERKIGLSHCSELSYIDIGDLFVGLDYTGKIDDVAIFKKILTQQEIDQLKNLEPCCE